jgi:hypothetical protein
MQTNCGHNVPSSEVYFQPTGPDEYGYEPATLTAFGFQGWVKVNYTPSLRLCLPCARPAWEGVACAECGGYFTEESWDSRHSVDYGSTEVHEGCCPDCLGGGYRAH